MDLRVKKPSFALLLTLFLLVLVATSASALSVLAGAESLCCARTSRLLQHQLALTSLINLMPALLNSPASPNEEATDRELDFSFGGVSLRCRVVRESGKQKPGSRSIFSQSALHDIAGRLELPSSGIDIMEMVPPPGAIGWPKVVCFDQLIRPSKFEEVYRRLHLESEGKKTQKKCWSDAISLWTEGGRQVLSATVRTEVASEVRHWYVVIRIESERAIPLFVSAI